MEIPYIIAASLIAVISYFLKMTMDELKETKKMAIENKNKIDIVENNHNHLTNKFDMLYDAVKDLTKEIKHLTIELSKKKNSNE